MTKKIKGPMMAYFFLGLIVLFFLISTIYLIRNDFSRETIDILFPAIGAILLSLYLGIKMVWLDAPKEKSFDTSIAVFQDYKNGKMTGLYPMGRVSDFDMNSGFLGILLFENIPKSKDFEKLELDKILKKDPHDEEVMILIGNIIEYAFYTWLGQPEMRIDYKLYYETDGLINFLSSKGGSYGKDFVPIPIEFPGEEPNPLIKTKLISVELPKGSEIIRSLDKRLYFKIVTRHSTFELTFTPSSGEELGEPLHKRAALIYQGLKLPNNGKGIYAHGFHVVCKTSQRPFTRFSKQAKLEANWLESLPEKLKRDFSWAKLRDFYIQD